MKHIFRIFVASVLVLAGLPAPVHALSDATDTVRIYQTVKDGAMDQRLEDLAFTDYDPAASGQYTVQVFSGDTRQEILGIGGAMTESSAYNLSLLTEQQRQEIYDAYFSEEGAHYSLVRITMGSADFSTRSYSYDDTEEPDPGLQHFSIAEDYKYVIPALHRIQEYRDDLKVFAAPWAPPAWMKKSGDRRGKTGTAALAFVDNSLKEEYYQSYALYFVKYLRAYESAGIPIYSISVQNEAQNNPKWEACTWSIEDTIDFVGNYLGPALERNSLDPELLIWDWDKGNDSMHGDGFINFNKGVLADANARKYIDGIAFHWYAGDLWHEIAGKPMWSEDFYSLDELKEAYPDIELYATEGCQEKGPWMNSFEPAERYIYDILNDFEHGTSSWIDWNLVLDHTGGPTQGVTNQCHAPIMLDENLNIVYNPSYYILKRLSQEIQPGTYSVRSEANFDGIERTAVRKANGETAVFLGNLKDYAQTVHVVDGGKMVTVELPAHSMTTLVYTSQANDRILEIASAEASSTQRSLIHDFSAENAIDDSLETRWSSEWSDQESITFQLAGTQTVTGVYLQFENGQDSAFEIQASSDGIHYETVYEVPQNTYREQEKVFFRFPAVQARYIRFQGCDRADRYGYSLWDAKIIGQ